MKITGVLLIVCALLLGCATKSVQHEWNEDPTGEIMYGTIFFNIVGDKAQTEAAGKFIINNFGGPITYQGYQQKFLARCETVEQIETEMCQMIPATLMVIPQAKLKSNA